MPKKNSRILLFLLVLSVQDLSAQIDHVGSGGAIKFDGFDDYIDFADIYDDLNLPFTISAWVYLDPSNSTAAPIFTNRNCDPIYTGFRLIVANNLISMDFGDGRGGNNPAFRRGKNANVGLLTGNWNHITAVVNGVDDIQLYLNGVNVGGYYIGESSFPMDSSKPGFASSAYFISNGVIYRFKGMIDDIRLWDRALSESEIRNTMCLNLAGDEPGLIGYWNFNELFGNTVFDLSSNHFNGTYVGAPTRVRSGAPIGDVSTHIYSSVWEGKSISLTNSNQTFMVKDVSNSSFGVQLYSVNNAPSQTIGLQNIAENPVYFGAFVVQQNQSSRFNAELKYENGQACQLFSRNDNSMSMWSNVASTTTNNTQRVELIIGEGSTVPALELGENVLLCDKSQYKMSTGIAEDGYSFLWSNNTTGSSTIVTESGKYFVTVTGACVTIQDSIQVEFLSIPESFSLGNSTESCEVTDTTLRVPACSGCTITWQDGSSGPDYYVKDFGTYWATVKNACGQASDSIAFSRISLDEMIPNVVTPNNDGKNDFFTVPESLSGFVSLDVYNRWGRQVYNSESYVNDWDGDDLSTGIYFAVLRGSCITPQKIALHIIR